MSSDSNSYDDRTPLLLESSGSSKKSQDPKFETRAQRKRRWLSLCIGYLGNFTIYAAESIYWSMLWPYLSEIDPSISESMYGFVVAAYALGAALTAPLYGYVCSRIRKTKPLMIAGACLSMLGNLIAIFVVDFAQPGRKWLMLIARFICGLGAGSLSVIEANLAWASTIHERNTVFALHNGIESFALFVGPGLQALFVTVGYPGIDNSFLHINMYTGPIFVVAAFIVLYSVLLIAVYKNYILAHKIDANSSDQQLNYKRKFSPNAILTWSAAFACIWIRSVFMFCLVYDDTLGSIFMMTMFRWTRSETILYNGIIQIAAGCVEILGNFIVLKFAFKYLRIRTVILMGIVLFIMFYTISFSWPGLPPIITEPSSDDQYNCTYAWCQYTSRVYLWQYLLGYVCLLLAFPFGYAPAQSLLSKIANLNSKRQGLFQGLGTSAEYLATLLGPVVVTTVYELQGPRVTWGIAGVLLVSALVVQSVLYERLGRIEDLVENSHATDP